MLTIQSVPIIWKYAAKIIRDIYRLDQTAAEPRRTRGEEVCAFWAIDTAAIEAALPHTEYKTGIKYAQVINSVPYAYYRGDDLIFDRMNPYQHRKGGLRLFHS